MGLTLSAVAAPTRTSPSPAVEASPLAGEEVGEDTPAAALPTLKAVSEEGSSSLPFLLGGLLVAAGAGALALVVLRRRNTPDAVAESAVPSTTQLFAPAGGSMADAPTAVLHTGAVGGFPGSYGAPPHGGIHQNDYRR